MEYNVSRREGAVRFGLGAILLLLALDIVPFVWGRPEVWAIPAIAAFGAILIATGSTHKCPIYASLGRRLTV